MPSSLLADLQQRAAQVGLNLCGVVDAVRFDACQAKDQRTANLQPGCGTVVVLGLGGREAWQCAAVRGAIAVGPAAAPGAWQEVTGRCVRELAAKLQANRVAARVVEPGARRGLNFARLGEAAGFGTVSPVTGLLLHPDFGPWVSLRAALLLDGRPFGPIPDASITDRFQPCCACQKPCVSACPATAHDGFGNQYLGRCAEHRHEGNCASSCRSRTACPIGAEHRDRPGEELHRHVHALPALQRQFGLGFWRFVPRFLRH